MDRLLFDHHDRLSGHRRRERHHNHIPIGRTALSGKRRGRLITGNHGEIDRFPIHRHGLDIRRMRAPR